MTNVNDLHIEKEILPLFDYTQNTFAYEALLTWLTNRPADLDTAFERQQIIKAFLANENKIQPAGYSRGDLYETHTFLSHGNSNKILINKSRTELGLHLLLFVKEKQLISAHIIQCVQLFYKLHNRYFARLSANDFPGEFAIRLNQINAFLQAFNVNKYEPLTRNGKFGISHLIELIHIFKSKFESPEINSFWNNLFLFEAYLSIATAHKKRNLQFPEFTNDNSFTITGFYHPALKSPVKNSITKYQNVLLLTGPNMAGKSTLLKSISLCVYLGHLGCGVPADSCRMPFFETISVAINVKDDLQSGYSHFLSEIKTLKSVVTDAAHKRCFAVFDELFKGTNIEDALEISKQTIQGLVQFSHSIFLISTHLHQLKNMINLQTISTYYIECLTENNTPVFTYTLKQGWSDLKLGRLLFEQEGLNRLLKSAK
jgi:DNA mismatch repair protein MutS